MELVSISLTTSSSLLGPKTAHIHPLRSGMGEGWKWSGGGPSCENPEQNNRIKETGLKGSRSRWPWLQARPGHFLRPWEGGHGPLCGAGQAGPGPWMCLGDGHGTLVSPHSCVGLGVCISAPHPACGRWSTWSHQASFCQVDGLRGRQSGPCPWGPGRAGVQGAFTVEPSAGT